MAEYQRVSWQSSLLSGLSRRDARGCLYDTYLPDKLQGRDFSFDGDVAADVAEAEAAIIRLNLESTVLTNTEVLARLLLRAESVASSKIEGLEVGGRRLLNAELSRQLGDKPNDITAAEVLANVEAMAWAASSISAKEDLTVDHLLKIHRRLLVGSRLSEHAGKLRQEQNWIGGSNINPCSATYVPPPYELVPELLADLCAFCNDNALPAVAQAALAHAQFETIHPFVDGNGRTGRVLIHLILRRRGLATHVLPPVSLVLATWTHDYIEGLTRTRHVGDAGSREALSGVNYWTALFASACTRSVREASDFEKQSKGLQAAWRERLTPVRKNSALDVLIDALPGIPVLTTGTAADFIGRSFQATNVAIAQLEAAGILLRQKDSRRNRAFESPEILEAFNRLERQLSSPEGDPQVSKPGRRVPSRAKVRH